MNYDDVLAVLPDSKGETKSIKDIAQAMGLGCSVTRDRRRRSQGLV
jgi:hypothetical protein